MKYNSATTLIEIENEHDYTNLKKPISMIHLLKPLTGDVIITSLDDSIIKFPPESFIVGGIYPIIIKEIKYTKKSDHKKFIGYSYV